MWSFPEAFIVVRSFWLSWLDERVSEGTDIAACLPWAEQSEADQSNLCIEQIENLYSLFCYLDVVHQSEPGVILDPALELLGQLAVVPDVLLQAAHTEVPDDKPELQRAEPSAQRDPPVLKWETSEGEKTGKRF